MQKSSSETKSTASVSVSTSRTYAYTSDGSMRSAPNVREHPEGSDGIASVERTLSSSSASSANSTSSIEAAPFRAPPLGNVRWYGRPSQELMEGLAPPIQKAMPWGTWASPENAAQGTSVGAVRDGNYTPVSGGDQGVERQRYLPKQLNDDWIFRNGPSVARRFPGASQVPSDALAGQKFALEPFIQMGENTFLTSNGTLAASQVNMRPSPLHTRIPAPSSIYHETITHPDTDPPFSDTTGHATHSYLPKDDRTFDLTPAEVVRMEARAGFARAPATPSAPIPCDDSCAGLPKFESLRSVDLTDAESKMRSSIRSSSSTLKPRSPSPGRARSGLSPPILPLQTRCQEVSEHGTAKTVDYSGASSSSQRKAHSDGRPASRASAHRRRTPNDYIFGEILGEGSYSTVMKAWDVYDFPEDERAALRNRPSVLQAAAGQLDNNTISLKLANGKEPQPYAVKVLDKVHILKEKKQKYVRVEKEALSLLHNCPGIVTLYHAFQDRESLYFVLELAANGEFLHHLQKHGSLDVTSVTFYAAQLADTIDCIHQAGVVHRDIKPENILLNEDMRILVTDFGSAKILKNTAHAETASVESSAGSPFEVDDKGLQRSSSFVGTAEYVSPELLNDKVAGIPADWWAFGCVLYQLFTGHAPFRAANEYKTFQKILRRDLTFPAQFPSAAAQLIDKLLSLDPQARPNAAEIKQSSFFQGIDFHAIWTESVPPMRTGLFRKSGGEQGTLFQGLRDLEAQFEELNRTHTLDDKPRHSETRFTQSGVSADEESISTSCESRSTSLTHSRTPNVTRAAPTAYIQHGTHTGTSSPLSGSERRLEERTTFITELYDDLLLLHEVVNFSSPIVLRRTGAGSMFVKRCQLLLTSYPRLLCVREGARTLNVLCEVILRPIPAYSAASESVPLARTRSQHSTSSRKDHGTSLKRQPSLPSGTWQQTISRSFSKMGSRGAGALNRWNSVMGIRPDTGTHERRDAEARAAFSTDHTNWLLDVEPRGSKGFVVHTPARQHIFHDPSGDPVYWIQCIREAQHQYAVSQS
ncbi:non-specific serine/threonine protein kinase [Malassezia vespertilionis]|uniref:non-specific serine/threonine protein kinase n=1 Tax=Malassezia vespertilionis TaxID=2020962 RepID=A0A2N1J9W0_9BASI|nr:non-specific serine/threonine protein kinase [Malassezia vespertilionis]PKI83339.1 Pkh3p [Malassezia vespertilionis]WFD07573.1 non-specific serine/threonine protein kinase [Malassezia vespertilionis]